MPRSLHGWRRKIGNSLLPLVVVLLAGWLRSNATGDALLFRLGNRQQALCAVGGRIYWWGIYSDRTAIGWNPSNETVEETLWKLAIGRDEYERDPGAHLSEWVIPYWVLVIPLLTVSGGLIWKRPAQPKSDQRGK